MRYLWMMLSLLAASTTASADDLMKTVASSHDFQATQTRLEAAIKEKGLTTFAKIDHAEGAKAVGLSMQPAIVTIFGSPKGGTPFMVASPQAAIDFPLKALVSQSADGKVSVSYYPVSAIVARHGIQGQDELAKKLDGLLASIAKAATE
jgi:uncharacterized protein (DUF302 family)